MTSRFYALLALALCGALLAAPGRAAAQAGVRASAEPTADSERVRVRAGLELVTRRFELLGPTDVEFVAPYYQGLRIELQAFPVAWFARDSALAPLFVTVETSKHSTTTVADVEVRGDTYDFEIPTRHDMSYFGLGYEWNLSRAASVSPRIGWRTTEFSLAYNEILRSSFYRGVEVGVAARVRPGTAPIEIGAGLDLRPGVSLGSTAQAFGDDASALGVAGLVRLTGRLPLGLMVSGDARVDWYRTRYTRSSGAGSDATDMFQSFVVSVGYAI